MSEDRLKEQCDYTMKKNRELIIENEKLKTALEKSISYEMMWSVECEFTKVDFEI
jgi:regulator of replication initiation timing